MPEMDPRVIAHYETHDQTDRLLTPAAGRLELLRTQELLRRHLPAAPARIIDVGGGPGTHARWLADDGHTVHLVDPVARHLVQAAEYAACTTELGDARALTAEDDTYDCALLLGPLYHLPNREDRLTALHEARRVVRPGGPMAVAAISRWALLLDYGTVSSLTGPGVRDRLGARLRTGYIPEPDHDPTGLFTAAYFHTSTELRAEVADAGLPLAAMYGIEGPSWSLIKSIERHTGQSVAGTALFDAAVEAARLSDACSGQIDMSAHMLAVIQT
ncbi:methyltransferase domain-containing protein [Streptomyces sp. AV19]|uniref:class I SAM-dependent methyltransferase n=1 Tax=Streptomyces sp. AV19 TaxID=2793068 RepID=UPI0018FE0935|nr:class I SAM-dependent methyltransferase [Streptomyces sp. AV19]MBH1937790.1 methyltransferase domain-containing protein [Streptomyces sp. AV19]MDG4537066.1 methyltransferase domain-containing protein [Streptomyces sp. AV19]